MQPALWIPIPCGKASQVSPGRWAQGPSLNTLPHVPEGARSNFPWTQEVRTVWYGELRAGPQIGGVCFLHQLNSMGVLHAHSIQVAVGVSCPAVTCFQWDGEHVVGVTPRAVTPEEQRKLWPVSSRPFHLLNCPVDIFFPAPSSFPRYFVLIWPPPQGLSLASPLSQTDNLLHPKTKHSVVRGIGPLPPLPQKKDLPLLSLQTLD